MAPGSLLAIQEEHCLGGVQTWKDVLHAEVYEPSWNHEVRLVLKDRPFDGNYAEGVNCWSVYAGDV